MQTAPSTIWTRVAISIPYHIKIYIEEVWKYLYHK